MNFKENSFPHTNTEYGWQFEGGGGRRAVVVVERSGREKRGIAGWILPAWFHLLLYFSAADNSSIISKPLTSVRSPVNSIRRRRATLRSPASAPVKCCLLPIALMPFLSLKRDNVNFPLKWVISSREGWTPARPGFMKWYISIILSSCSNSNLFSQFCDEVVCNIWSLKSVSHVLRNNQKKNSIYCFGGFGGAG